MMAESDRRFLGSDPPHWRDPAWLKEQLRLCNALGQGTRVGIVDTGIEQSILEARQQQRGYSMPPVHGVIFHQAKSPPSPYRGLASAPHGTTVADIILRTAPQSQLFSADIFGMTGTPDVELLVTAIRHCVDAWQCQVINLSLGVVDAQLTSPHRRQLLLRTIEECYHRQIIIVAAAHNDHPTTRSYPAVFSPPLLSVERGVALEEDQFAYVAHEGIEFAAVGRGYFGPFCMEPANSWAAPHVSGWVACLLSWLPDLQPFEVKTLLYWLSKERADSNLKKANAR